MKNDLSRVTLKKKNDRKLEKTKFSINYQNPYAKTKI